MDLIKCPQCGSQFPVGTKKCPVCDAALAEETGTEENSGSTVETNPRPDREYYRNYAQNYVPEAQEAPEKQYGSGMAIASMVLGIFSILLMCVIVGILPGIIGLVLGIIVVAKGRPGRGMAIAGIVTSVVGILLSIMMIVVSIGTYTQLAEDGYINYTTEYRTDFDNFDD